MSVSLSPCLPILPPSPQNSPGHTTVTSVSMAPFAVQETVSGGAVMDRRLLIVPLFALVGCVNEKENDMLVQPNPFTGPTQVTRAQTSFPQANVESAARVDQLGRKIL